MLQALLVGAQGGAHAGDDYQAIQVRAHLHVEQEFQRKKCKNRHCWLEHREAHTLEMSTKQVRVHLCVEQEQLLRKNVNVYVGEIETEDTRELQSWAYS